jgi:hypothetical protein
MENPFSQDTITLYDFIMNSVTFVLAMAVFFELKNRRHWLNYLFMCLLALHWITAMAFKPLASKLFTTLLLASAVIVQVVLRRKWKMESR